MSTPTPRTNRAWNTLGDDNAEAAWSFARTLERELHESRNAEMLARVQLGNERARLAHAAVQLATEREKVRTLRLACERIVAEWDSAYDANPIGAGGWMYSLASKALGSTEDTKT
jgi:hypothetical protein